MTKVDNKKTYGSYVKGKKRSNLDVLTSGAKIYAKKRKFKEEQIEEIKFDEVARREFLTGFQKRNKERKEAARKNAKKRELEERKQLVKEQRIEKIRSIQPMLSLLNEVNAGSEKDTSEKEPNSTLEFSNTATVTTVSIDADMLDDDDTVISPLSLLKKIQARSQNLKDGASEKTSGDEEEGVKGKPRKRQHKAFRYETKADRMKTNSMNNSSSKKSFQSIKKGRAKK